MKCLFLYSIPLQTSVISSCLIFHSKRNLLPLNVTMSEFLWSWFESSVAIERQLQNLFYLHLVFKAILCMWRSATPTDDVNTTILYNFYFSAYQKRTRNPPFSTIKAFFFHFSFEVRGIKRKFKISFCPPSHWESSMWSWQAKKKFKIQYWLMLKSRIIYKHNPKHLF